MENNPVSWILPVAIMPLEAKIFLRKISNPAQNLGLMMDRDISVSRSVLPGPFYTLVL